MGPIPLNPWVNGALPTPTQDNRTRCFVAAVIVTNPDHNRLVSRVSFKADHAISNGFEGSIAVVDGSQYRVGDVILIEIS